MWGLLFIVGLFNSYSSNSLKIEVTGIAKPKGNIHVALYRKTDDFPSIKSTYKTKIQAASSNEVVFENLDENEYAVAVFLDENKNGVLDKNMFGVPTEKYGFSNNARGTFSAPSFKEAKISLKDNKTIQIKIY